MTYPQAIFVKKLVQQDKPLREVAELFYKQFGTVGILKDQPGHFSNLDGNDLKSSAKTVLREKF